MQQEWTATVASSFSVGGEEPRESRNDLRLYPRAARNEMRLSALRSHLALSSVWQRFRDETEGAAARPRLREWYLDGQITKSTKPTRGVALRRRLAQLGISELGLTAGVTDHKLPL